MDLLGGFNPIPHERSRLPLVHPLPYVGSFPEVNVRTYALWRILRCMVFSLDINKILPTVTAEPYTKFHIAMAMSAIENR